MGKKVCKSQHVRKNWAVPKLKKEWNTGTEEIILPGQDLHRILCDHPVDSHDGGDRPLCEHDDTRTGA